MIMLTDKLLAGLLVRKGISQKKMTNLQKNLGIYRKAQNPRKSHRKKLWNSKKFLKLFLKKIEKNHIFKIIKNILFESLFRRLLRSIKIFWNILYFQFF